MTDSLTTYKTITGINFHTNRNDAPLGSHDKCVYDATGPITNAGDYSIHDFNGSLNLKFSLVQSSINNSYVTVLSGVNGYEPALNPVIMEQCAYNVEIE